MQDIPFEATVEASLSTATRATMGAVRLAMANLAALEAGLVASTTTSARLEWLGTLGLAVAVRLSVNYGQ